MTVTLKTVSRNCFLFILMSIPLLLKSQNNKDSVSGLEALSYFKSKTQSMIISFGANIPDSSKIFKEYNLKINECYNEVKARYDQYRGFMKDCILDNSSTKKLKLCLKSKNLSLKLLLDSLQGLINDAYIKQFIAAPPKDHKPIDTTVNVAVTPTDFIASIITALADGAIKIWTQINNLKKQQKDDYLAQISSKDYDLSEYSDLISTSHKK
jgi:hypothetical protein